MWIYHRRLSDQPASRLVTSRLVLRHLEEKDATDLYRTVGDPEVMQHWHPGPDPDVPATGQRIDEINAHWHTYGFGDWGVVEKMSGDLIGFCGLHFIAGISPRCALANFVGFEQNYLISRSILRQPASRRQPRVAPAQHDPISFLLADERRAGFARREDSAPAIAVVVNR